MPGDECNNENLETKVPVSVVLPDALMRLFPDAVSDVQLYVSTVDEMIDALNERWPGMRDRLCDSTPSIRRHLRIFANGRPAELATPLAPGMRVFVLTAMSGG